MLIADSLTELSTFVETFAETFTLVVENIFLALIIFVDVISFIFFVVVDSSPAIFSVFYSSSTTASPSSMTSIFILLLPHQLSAPSGHFSLPFSDLISKLIPKYLFSLIQHIDRIYEEAH